MAVPTRMLWAGADGTAFDADRLKHWRIVAMKKNGVVLSHAINHG